MVMPVRPFTHVCEDCGRSRAVIPNSDVLSPKDCPDTCPGCGSAHVKMRPAKP